MARLDSRELAFVKAHEICRLATASRDAVPHVVPVIYAIEGSKFVIAVDYGTRKLKNLRENAAVSLVVDDERPNRAVMVQGRAAVVERGREYLRLLKILFDRFEYYRTNPWGEGEAPIVVVTPQKVVSWGLG